MRKMDRNCSWLSFNVTSTNCLNIWPSTFYLFLSCPISFDNFLSRKEEEQVIKEEDRSSEDKKQVRNNFLSTLCTPMTFNTLHVNYRDVPLEQQLTLSFYGWRWVVTKTGRYGCFCNNDTKKY